jgi:hypothetical protein
VAKAGGGDSNQEFSGAGLIEIDVFDDQGFGGRIGIGGIF